MRRALSGIVPDEILKRKRKAYVARAPLIAISGEWMCLLEMTHEMAGAQLGIVEPQGFLETLHKVRHGQDVPIVPFLRTVTIEAWLRKLTHTWQLAGIHEQERNSSDELARNLISAEKTYPERR